MYSGFEQSLRSMLKSVLVEVVKEVTSSDSRQQQQPDLTNLKSPPLLWRPSEAAKALAISERHLSALTRSEKIPCVRISRLVRYDPDALRHWVRFANAAGRVIQTGENHRERDSTGMEAKARRKQPRQLKSKECIRQTLEAKQLRGTARTVKPKTKPESQRSDGLKPRDVRGFFAERIGIDRDELPVLTHGQLMRVAGCDTATLHGWIYLGRELPEIAIQKLQSFYADDANRVKDEDKT